jgi:hypothetical protein
MGGEMSEDRMITPDMQSQIMRQELITELQAKNADLEAQVAKVRERHRPIEANHPQIKSEICEECSRPDEGEFTFHPCPTIRDLDGVGG